MTPYDHRRPRFVAALIVMSGTAGHAMAQGAPSAAPVPVTTAKAKRADVPVYLRGIGTVQAQNTATIRARVDGTLQRVPVAEGQEVKAGELLAVIDPRPYQAVLDQAMAKKAQDEATASNARADLSRYSALANSNFASRQQVDTQQATVAGTAALLKADEASVSAAQLNLSYCYLLAPFDGRVGLRQIDPGNLIHANDATGIMTLSQLRPIAVVFTLPQDVLPAVAAAMGAGAPPPVIAATGDDKNELDHGTLLTVDNAIDAATGTIKAKAIFPNASGKLWPGQFVNARLLADTRKNVLTIPSGVVQHGPDGLYAYVVKPDSTVGRSPIEVPQDNGDVAVVAKGLDEGTEVVLTGQSRLQAGLKVAVGDDPSKKKPEAASAAADPPAAKTGG